MKKYSPKFNKLFRRRVLMLTKKMVRKNLNSVQAVKFVRWLICDCYFSYCVFTSLKWDDNVADLFDQINPSFDAHYFSRLREINWPQNWLVLSSLLIEDYSQDQV